MLGSAIRANNDTAHIERGNQVAQFVCCAGKNGNSFKAANDFRGFAIVARVEWIVFGTRRPEENEPCPVVFVQPFEQLHKIRGRPSLAGIAGTYVNADR